MPMLTIATRMVPPSRARTADERPAYQLSATGADRFRAAAIGEQLHRRYTRRVASQTPETATTIPAT